MSSAGVYVVNLIVRMPRAPFTRKPSLIRGPIMAFTVTGPSLDCQPRAFDGRLTGATFSPPRSLTERHATEDVPGWPMIR